jgi:hypothetical protein
MKKPQNQPKDAKTLTPEEEAQKKYRRGRVYVRTGQAIMAGGAIVAIVHWLAHLEAFGPGQPSGWIDIVAGYPMGAVLLMVGAMVAGQKPK